MDAGVKTLFQSMGKPMLRYFVYAGGVSPDEAKDVLQETLIKIVRGAASFGGHGTAKAWMWQVARNCLVDHQRKQMSIAKREVAINDDQWDSLAERPAEPKPASPKNSVEECVAAGLDAFRIREPDRHLVLTLQMEGTSIEEIGYRIGRTMAATKEYLSQCRKKIQPFIAHCTDLLAT